MPNCSCGSLTDRIFPPLLSSQSVRSPSWHCRRLPAKALPLTGVPGHEAVHFLHCCRSARCSVQWLLPQPWSLWLCLRPGGKHVWHGCPDSVGFAGSHCHGWIQLCLLALLSSSRFTPSPADCCCRAGIQNQFTAGRGPFYLPDRYSMGGASSPPVPSSFRNFRSHRRVI